MNARALISEAKEALKSKWSADQLESLHGQIKSRINELVRRLKEITVKDVSTLGGNPGPERQRLIENGDVKALRALDDEERALGPELEVLRDLAGKLRRQLDAQRAIESVERMPQEYEALGELISAEARARAAARKAQQAVDAKLQDIREQRHHVMRQTAVRGQSLEYPAASTELLAQYIATRGFEYHRDHMRVGWFSPSGGPRQLGIVAESLGLPVPSPDQMAA